MRVDISFYMDKEEDGVSGTVNLTRDDVDSLQDLLYFFRTQQSPLAIPT